MRIRWFSRNEESYKDTIFNNQFDFRIKSNVKKVMTTVVGG